MGSFIAADNTSMELPRTSAPQSEIRFLLSLLRITNPGEPASEQSQSLEDLLAGETKR